MALVVIDTDVISFYFKRDSRARLYRPYLLGRTGVVSFMTVAELDEWAEQHHWGQRQRERLERHLSQFIVHYPNRALCRQWAEVRSRTRRRGRRLDVADAWIAATALALDVPLVTHNPSDYAGLDDLTVVSAKLSK